MTKAGIGDPVIGETRPEPGLFQLEHATESKRVPGASPSDSHSESLGGGRVLSSLERCNVEFVFWIVFYHGMH